MLHGRLWRAIDSYLHDYKSLWFKQDHNLTTKNGARLRSGTKTYKNGTKHYVQSKYSRFESCYCTYYKVMKSASFTICRLIIPMSYFSVQYHALSIIQWLV